MKAEEEDDDEILDIEIPDDDEVSINVCHIYGKNIVQHFTNIYRASLKTQSRFAL